MQQVWSFGATDVWPGNVVGDDGWVGWVGEGGWEGDWEGVERGERVQGRGRGLMVVNGDGDEDEDESKENRYQRMAGVVDRKHRSLVQSLVGPPSASASPPHPLRRRSGDGGGGGGVDVKALRQMERNLSALGF